VTDSPVVDAELAARLAGMIREVPDYPKPGIGFKDITPLLADGALFSSVIDSLAAPHVGGGIDLVVGIEARGFILAAPVAVALGAGFVPVRKRGKLPWTTRMASYDLEYGSAEIEVHEDAVGRGQRVLVIDDVLATGGTAAAACSLVEQSGGVVAEIAMLMELTFLDGRAALGKHRVRALVSY
jgi:adenine phosphoribosyltransferase